MVSSDGWTRRILQYLVFRGVDHQPCFLREKKVFYGDEIGMCKVQISGFEDDFLLFPCKMDAVYGHVREYIQHEGFWKGDVLMNLRLRQ